MIENELRIGNLVQFSEDGTIFTVGSIEEKGFTVQNEEETTWIESELFEPIPLTEERLLEFGFEKDVSKYNICWFLNHVYIWFVDGEYINELDLPIDYVHQLQNLYFVLTGEELTIKEVTNDNK